ncbi:hypothetical protein ACFSMW_15690 [Virgibacillus halophilus]|uniref:Uncharacterized protein n=1 Tax=Tigheibacillus halophilus TaxID=361280 RepID=A0ABU5CCD5_9BACI|nr:hypothetical protein [Virgibacillus halophilus]
MHVIADGRLCEEKMKLLRQGYTAYVESPTLVQRLSKEIRKENLQVQIDYTQGGCYFIPVQDAISS